MIRSIPSNPPRYYPKAIIKDDLVFVSGLGALDPAKNYAVIDGDIVAQAEFTLKRIREILEEAGSSLQNSLRVTIYLKNVKDRDRLRPVLEKHFQDPSPAMTLVGSDLVNVGMLLEVEVTAYIPRKPSEGQSR